MHVKQQINFDRTFKGKLLLGKMCLNRANLNRVTSTFKELAYQWLLFHKCPPYTKANFKVCDHAFYAPPSLKCYMSIIHHGKLQQKRPIFSRAYLLSLSLVGACRRCCFVPWETSCHLQVTPHQYAP